MVVDTSRSHLAKGRFRLITRLRLRTVVLASSSVAFFLGLSLLLYDTSFHSAAGASDKATTLLVGQSMESGRLLLQGWILPPGNYWTTDVTIYAVAIRIFGFHPGLLYSEPAVIAAATIVIGILFAREGRRGAAAVAGATAVVSLLAFCTPAMALWFVGNGFHIATALYVLIAFWLLRRGSFGWRWVLATMILAFGMLGDLEILAFGIIPLFLGGCVEMVRRRRWRAGIALVTAGLSSALLGDIASRGARAAGGFKPSAALPVAHFHQMLTNVKNMFVYSGDLLGITNGHRFGTAGIPSALLEVHAFGALCVIASLLAGIVSLIKGMINGTPRDGATASGLGLWRIDDLLVLATLGSAALFVLLAGANGVGIHFLSIPMVFASVLSGRMVSRIWPKLAPGWQLRGAATAGIVVSLAFAAGLGDELARPAPTQPVSYLTAFLEAHTLSSGIGGYWASAITSVVSDESVNVRPVGIAANGRVDRMGTQTTGSWYAGQTFQFFVSDTRHSGNVANADVAAAERTWGRPAHLYKVGAYRVLTWAHPLRVAA